MNGLENIGNSEVEIMKILWRLGGRPATSAEIRKELEIKQGWTKSTILTMIRRLVEKGFIACKKKEVFYYSPCISEKEYLHHQTKNFIDKIYDGNIKNLLTTLCQADDLSKSDLEELQSFLNQEAGKNG